MAFGTKLSATSLGVNAIPNPLPYLPVVYFPHGKLAMTTVGFSLAGTFQSS